MRRLSLVLIAVVFAAASLAAQAVLDRVLSNVNGDVITQLDVRQARMLKLPLVTEPAESDADILRGLENRRLVVAEVSHVALPPPAAADITAHRREWEGSIGAGTNLPQLLDRAGLTEAGLSAWMRDDVRIQMYIAQRFGGVPEADRPANIQRWLATLREHAGLAKEDPASSSKFKV